MKKEYLEPQSAVVPFPCFVWMAEGISGYNEYTKPSEGSEFGPKAPKTV